MRCVMRLTQCLIKKRCETGDTDFVKTISAKGNGAGVGEGGELYSRGPMCIDECYEKPERPPSVASE